ncbi:L,D-transpeptidase family protein [Fodinicurvata sp. EGI_FJ10296]|uniref:L,D-transpeptidase family protein n=1 Tax=Fodinicurvata sp. EGI_FJ10296 TaxID=3231908 RepID=UPI0034569029
MLRRREFVVGAGALAVASAAGIRRSAAIAAEMAEPERGSDIIGTPRIHVARHEDTLVTIARENDVGFVELRLANPGVDVWLPGEGTRISLPTQRILPNAPREGIVLNLSEMRFYYYNPETSQVRTHPIGIGREGRGTPTGTTRIVRRQHLPTWYPPASIRAERPELAGAVPPGPDNPLGEHALYFDWPAYLMHGTNTPEGVGRRVSAGCIRMYPEDIETVFEIVPINTLVTIVDQEVKLGWHEGELYLEVNPSQDQADEIEMQGDFTRRLPENLVARVMDEAGDRRNDVALDDVRRIGMFRPGYPIRIT